MRTAFDSNGSVVTTTFDCDNPDEVVTVNQNLKLCGDIIIDDEDGMELSMSADIDTSANINGKEVKQSQNVYMEATASMTELSMKVKMDNAETSVKVSADANTMKSLMKSKNLRLLTEDGKEVKIELNY